MGRPKPAGAVRRGGHLQKPSSGAGLELADIQRRRPRAFTEDEREAWNRFARQLSGVRQVSETDLAALELLCYAYADLRAARAALEEHGRTYEEPMRGGGTLLKARPEVAMASDAARRMRQLLVELGMTPASRGKVERDPPSDEKKPDNPFEVIGDEPPAAAPSPSS